MTSCVVQAPERMHRGTGCMGRWAALKIPEQREQKTSQLHEKAGHAVPGEWLQGEMGLCIQVLGTMSQPQQLLRVHFCEFIDLPIQWRIFKKFLVSFRILASPTPMFLYMYVRLNWFLLLESINNFLQDQRRRYHIQLFTLFCTMGSSQLPRSAYCGHST